MPGHRLERQRPIIGLAQPMRGPEPLEVVHDSIPAGTSVKRVPRTPRMSHYGLDSCPLMTLSIECSTMARHSGSERALAVDPTIIAHRDRREESIAHPRARSDQPVVEQPYRIRNSTRTNGLGSGIQFNLTAVARLVHTRLRIARRHVQLAFHHGSRLRPHFPPRPPGPPCRAGGSCWGGTASRPTSLHGVLADLARVGVDLGVEIVEMSGALR